ncbi:MAG: methyl-accepting chemotaxis protein [Deltaproteobacteria bacterium]
MKLKIRGRILVGNLIGLIVFSVVLYFTFSIAVSDLANQEVSEKLDSIVDLSMNYIDLKYPGKWSLGADNKLYKGKVLMETPDKKADSTAPLNVLMDDLGKKGGSFVTIFRGEYRVATNVIKKSDSGVSERPYLSKVAAEVKKDIYDDKKEFFAGAVDVAGIQCRAKYVPLTDKDGKVIGMFFAGVDREKVSELVNKFSVVSLFMIIGCSILFIIISFSLYTRITNRITKVADLMRNVEEKHDLTIHSDIESSDETGMLSHDLNSMVGKLKGIVKDVKSSSMNVLGSSEKLAASTEESGASMEEIAASINSIARGMLDNSKFIVNTSENVKQVAKSAEDVAASCEELVDESKKVRNDAFNGGNSVKQVLNSVAEINTSSKQVEEVINELGKLSQEIGEIIEIITGISTQTNLLSLNAAIEAARAGEAGRGFSVVAEEIRKLAAGSSEAAKDITKLIVDVQNKTSNAVQKMQEGAKKAEDGLKKATDTSEYIQGIIASIDNIAKQIDDISKSANVQAEISKQMNSAMMNILSITESTASSAQEMSASVQEQTSVFQELGNVASELSQSALSMNNMVNKFKVD